MKTILIVEDELPIREMLNHALTQAGFHVLEAANVLSSEKILEKQLPDLILLDWMLPGMSGIDYAKKLKTEKTTQHIPIIMITARAEEESKVKGLETADDYITKPLSPRELIARIHTVLRRGPLILPSGLIQLDGLRLDTQHQKLHIHQHEIELTVQEYKLLFFLVSHKNHICSREKLLDHVWGRTSEVDLRTVDVQIRRLRDKLKPFHYEKYIQTKRGMGYVFKYPTT